MLRELLVLENKILRIFSKFFEINLRREIATTFFTGITTVSYNCRVDKNRNRYQKFSKLNMECELECLNSKITRNSHAKQCFKKQKTLKF